MYLDPSLTAYERLRLRTHQVVDKADDDDNLSHLVDMALAFLIVLNVCALTLETVAAFNDRYDAYLRAFEAFSLLIFTVEYVLRVWSCTAEEKYAHPIKGRLRYALAPMMLLDLLVILPFYFRFMPWKELRYGRSMRLLRLVRIIRIGRYSASLRTFAAVFLAKKEELSIAVFAELILLVVSAALLYFVEHKAQPDVFTSIPAAMWWGMSTLTTVGYGDMVPITVWGQVLAMIVSLLGIAMFALPVGILGAGFVEEVHHGHEIETPTCPCCGEELHDDFFDDA
jgi:voltage-gated potassium channel